HVFPNLLVNKQIYIFTATNVNSVKTSVGINRSKNGTASGNSSGGLNRGGAGPTGDAGLGRLWRRRHQDRACRGRFDARQRAGAEPGDEDRKSVVSGEGVG